MHDGTPQIRFRSCFDSEAVACVSERATELTFEWSLAGLKYGLLPYFLIPLLLRNKVPTKCPGQRISQHA